MELKIRVLANESSDFFGQYPGRVGSRKEEERGLDTTHGSKSEPQICENQGHDAPRVVTLPRSREKDEDKELTIMLF